MSKLRSAFVLLSLSIIGVAACSHGPSSIPGDPLHDSVKRRVVAAASPSPTDFVIYDSLRKINAGASEAPYVVGQHMVFTVKSLGGHALTHIQFFLEPGGNQQLVSTYNFPATSQFNSPGPATVITANPAPSASSVAFFPVLPGTVSVIAYATNGPDVETTTVTIPIVAPSVVPTAAVTPWAVDSNYAYMYPSPRPSVTAPPATYIHLGGATTATAAAGISMEFYVTNTSSLTQNADIALVQIIYACSTLNEKSGTTYYGTTGPPGMFDTLDGHIGADTNVSSRSYYYVYFSDSPGLPLPTETASASASELDGFYTYVMYKSNVVTDSKVPNIWVPLNEYLFWDWTGAAQTTASYGWKVATSPSPLPRTATVYSEASLQEPTWAYELTFPHEFGDDKVSACQAF